MTHKHKHDTPVPSATPADNPPAAPATEPAAAAVTPKTVTLTEAELAQLKTDAAKAAENWDKFLRTTADLENYRKRVAREKEELTRAAHERVVAALLPVLDNFERAIAATTDASPLLDGIKQIQTQFRRALEDFGLKEVVVNAGHPFDPNVHEAISHVEHPELPEGTIVNQFQRGYKLADRLVRPARVVVSKGKAQAEGEVSPPQAEPSATKTPADPTAEKKNSWFKSPFTK